MKNTEILQKAIDKAVKNGWDIAISLHEIWGPIVEYRVSDEKQFEIRLQGFAEFEKIDILQVLYSSDKGFAKAFWRIPNRKIKVVIMPRIEAFPATENIALAVHEESYSLNEWQYHLQQMVLEEDPINYLSKFI